MFAVLAETAAETRSARNAAFYVAFLISGLFFAMAAGYRSPGRWRIMRWLVAGGLSAAVWALIILFGEPWGVLR